jgi:hemerythrin-like domain-containing protein
VVRLERSGNAPIESGPRPESGTSWLESITADSAQDRLGSRTLNCILRAQEQDSGSHVRAPDIWECDESTISVFDIEPLYQSISLRHSPFENAGGLSCSPEAPMNDRNNRRTFLAAISSGALLVGCRKDEAAPTAFAAASAHPSPSATRSEHAAGENGAEDVGAVEDLMREHGVIRRVLVVYREAASRLRTKAGAVPPDALQKAAKLMRTFGEDYHEKQLEEANIFPALVKGNGSLTGTVNTLITQHKRGREITEYVLTMTTNAVGAQSAEPLARTLEAFARMYEEHAALEDTIVFPAWKKVLTPKELDEMGDRFEDIERKTFGKDGFEDAVEQVGAIEKSLGIDLAGLTAPPPPTKP